MKAYIGPYRDRISGPLKLQDWYFAKRFGVVGYDYSEKDYTWYDHVVEKVTDAMMDVLNKTINKYLDKNERKIKIHIDDYDVWGADHTIALIVHPILLKLKSKKHGSPHVDDDDVPEHLRSTSAPPKENEWDIDDNTHARWDWVMDEMIWAFEQKIQDDGESQFYDHSGVNNSANLNTQIGQIKVDRTGLEAYQKRMANGFRLFGKYYQGLWD